VNLPYYIAAHFVFTGKSVVKNGIINFTPQGVVSGVEAWGKGAAEKARTRFFSGLVLPSIHLSPNNGTKLSDVILLTDEDFSNLTLIDCSGLLLQEIAILLMKIQQRFDLTGDAFLDFWKILCQTDKAAVGKTTYIEPGNACSLMQLFGIEPLNWLLNSKTVLKLISPL
jgi:hypothetical protein